VGLACAAIGYTARGFIDKGRVNKMVRMEENKIVDSVDIEDIGKQKCFCRCWKSKSFPYCDGSHNKHNQDTGDNVGPLLVKKTE